MHTENTPRFFILPGLRTYVAARHPEDLARSLAVT
jgi:hypothetical protein